MFMHYLLTAFRNILKRKTDSIINISGLAIGMACCILILIFIATELSYDRYHKNAERIYRVAANVTLGGTPNAIASSNAPPAPTMRDDYPEVIGAARFKAVGKVPVSHQDRQFYEERFLYADNSVFEVFTFPLVQGDPTSALEAPYTVVITEDMAAKYFGDGNPIGQVLKLNNADDFTITGVMRDVPRNSHFVFDALCSFETLTARDPEQTESWLSPLNHYSYILLQENADWKELESKLPGMVEKYVGDSFKSFGASIEYFLQPLTDIHLHSNLRHELAANSDVSYIYIFGAIALSILLIACFNFMNIATSRASTRAKEVGVRKVLGADRGELIKQFLGESLLYSFIALLLAMVLAHLAMPVFGELLAADSVARAEGISSMTERSLSINYLEMPWLIPAFAGLSLVVGILAGSYPAFFLAAFQPAQVIKGTWRSGSGSPVFRRLVVAVQFTTSIVLMISTSVVLSQLNHMQSIRLGFDKEHVVVIPVMDEELQASVPSMKEELATYNGVVSVGASSHVLGQRPSGGSYVPEGYPEGQSEMMDYMSMDEDYIPAMGMEIAAGRNFSRDFPSDVEEAILINEAAARKFGWDDPVGKRIKMAADQEGVGRVVVGVVRDFHFSSPHRLVTPIYITARPFYRAIFVRILPDDIPATIEFLRSKWAQFDPHRPFEYFFLDESYDQQFRAEQNLGKLFGSFTFLAILIACLGLYGISSFAAERRTKEIGIRKVLGSSVRSIVTLLSREMVILWAISNLIAWPLAYIFMQRWLDEFPYRTNIGLSSFLAAAALMLVIGFATVSYRSIRAATADPVRSLRYE